MIRKRARDHMLRYQGAGALIKACLLLLLLLQVVAKVGEFKPQELANVVWALASMEHYSPELMEVGAVCLLV